MRSAITTASLALVALALAGCLDETRYVGPGENGEGVYAFAIDETTPAFIESEDGAIYIVEERVTFEFREPTDEELEEMAMVGDLNVPYGSLPFLRRGDYEVQIDYTLSNLGDSTVTTGLMVNGINEFHEYQPGVQIVDEELVPDFSGYERTIRLEAGERYMGTIREEQLDEVAVDLATVVNGAPNPNQVLHPENQSFNDARSMMFVPDMVPALTGVRVGLRSTSNQTPVLAEFSIRIRDFRRVLVQGDDEPWPLPAPAIVTPAALAPPAM